MILIITMTTMAGYTFAEENEEELIGTWYAHSQVDGTMEIDAEMMQYYGMDTIMIFNRGGTGSIATGSQIEDATWMDGIFSTKDGNASYQLEGDTLIVTNLQNGVVGTFKKTKPEIRSVNVGAKRTDLTLEDFNGTWKTTICAYFEETIPICLTGIDFTLDIKDGEVKYHEVNYESCEFKVVQEKEYTYYGTFDENTATLKIETPDPIFERAGGADELDLTLYEDGRMVCLIPNQTKAVNQIAEEINWEKNKQMQQEYAEETNAGPKTVEEMAAEREKQSQEEKGNEDLPYIYFILEKSTE